MVSTSKVLNREGRFRRNVQYEHCYQERNQCYTQINVTHKSLDIIHVDLGSDNNYDNNMSGRVN